MIWIATNANTKTMIRVGIKIADGNIVDTADTYGLVYVSSDNTFAPETKGFESSTYPEDEGEHIIPKSTDAPFDYTVKFYVKAEGSRENANAKIATFNNALYDFESQNSKVKVFKKVEFYNYYKKCLIVGYPFPISEATDFWRDSNGNTHDVVVVEWKIRVTMPSECNFNYTPPAEPTEEEEQTEQEND